MNPVLPAGRLNLEAALITLGRHDGDGGEADAQHVGGDGMSGLVVGQDLQFFCLTVRLWFAHGHQDPVQGHLVWN